MGEIEQYEKCYMGFFSKHLSDSMVEKFQIVTIGTLYLSF